MGAPQKSQANSNSMQRVKVYRLNDDGKWDDQGTGHVTVDYLERSEELGLFVYDEEDNETILSHRISSDDIYRKQEDTIISWRDPEYATELALSFQEPGGCSYIWDNVCNVQRNMHFNTLNSEAFHSVNSELRDLPAVELSTLPLILKTVAESGITDQLRLTELILTDQDFFRKLIEVFRVCEDLENMDGLHMIFKIMKGIILLNSTQIFERMFNDEFIMDIVGALEYDPEVPHVQHHRKFLKEHVIFKEVIPIKNTVVLSKIHQTYRIGFLKDVVLARVSDEGTVANLNSMIHANNATVVSLLKDDTTFIQELFARLKSPTTSPESKKNMIHFLHEFCGLSKSLPMVQQIRLFRDLMNEGIFGIVTDILQSQDKKLVLTGTDIVILFLNQDPNLLRSYVVRQEGVTLLGLLVRGMLTDFGDDMHCQFLEILRSLLDSFTLSGAQRDTIIDIFYEKHLGQLIEVITASCPSENITNASSKTTDPDQVAQNQSGVKPEILLNICELLCFCVLHHPYRIKCDFLLNNVIDKILLLTRRREKYLVAEASSEEDFNGKAGQSTVLRIAGLGSKRVGLIGLGQSSSTTALFKGLGEAVVAAAKSAQASNVAIVLASSEGLTPQSKLSTAYAIASGAVLGLFEDNRYKSESKKPTLRSVDIIGLGTGPELEKKLKYAGDVSSGVIFGRELVNSPANVLTPAVLAEEASKIASTYSDVFTAKILNAEQCKELKMGSYLGVAAASANPPHFIHLSYKPPSGPVNVKLALVGKGLTFDSGGYNIKTGAGCSIELMKFDMGGSAAVLGAAKALGQIKPLGVEVHFIVAACENMISGTGMRPGDVVTASNGKTIEVNNTDAEGRLTLADALVYACNQGVEKIVDLATLTGACVVALGPSIAGVFTPNDELAKEVIEASEVSGEKLWRLPLEESYWESMKSGVADMVNTGGRQGGSITAALFLKQFVDEKVQWMHIDMAGPVWNDKKRAATGFGVATLVEWVLKNSS